MKTRLLSCLLFASAVGACVDVADEDTPELETETVEQGVCASPDPFDCEPTGGTLDAPEITATARTASSLSVQFPSSSWWTSTALQRRPVTSTTWTTIASFAGGYTGTRAWTDGGRAADAIYCYRTRISDGTTTAYSAERCALTLPATSSPRVNRLQLRLVIADIADAGTGDNVGVNLSEMLLPGYNHTGLDYAPVKTSSIYPYNFVDDFKRGRDFTYDLDLGSVATLHDISEIKLHKYGTDGMCVQQFQLLVNGRVAYDRNFGSATCQWIDGDDGHQPTFTVTHAQLRAAPQFATYASPVPPLYVCPVAGGGWCMTIPRSELESRIEGMVGNKIWISDDLYWSSSQVYGPRAVEVSQGDASTLRVDLDLAGNVPYAPDPEVDIDFDIGVSFEPAGGGYDLILDVKNLHVATDFAWWAEALGVLFTPFCGSGSTEIGCAGAVEDTISAAVSDGFDVQSQRIPMGTSGFCTAPPFAIVQSDGSLMLGCQ
ncbi:MAG TPA: hypothetical protein VFQ53_11175 [Kofleriaceae bacterium]|nr:hypothetical protein [Kofleriaceae bacterium]